jgi:hypothetical protein
MGRKTSMVMAIAGACFATGCVVAAVGGGALAGVHVTSQGAEADVESNIQGTEGRVRAAFRQLGIEMTGEASENSGREREFKGSVDELDITVSLETRDHGTHIDASARRSLASWDQEYAERLVARIVGG